MEILLTEVRNSNRNKNGRTDPVYYYIPVSSCQEYSLLSCGFKMNYSLRILHLNMCLDYV